MITEYMQDPIVVIQPISVEEITFICASGRICSLRVNQDEGEPWLLEMYGMHLGELKEFSKEEGGLESDSMEFSTYWDMLGVGKLYTDEITDPNKVIPNALDLLKEECVGKLTVGNFTCDDPNSKADIMEGYIFEDAFRQFVAKCVNEHWHSFQADEMLRDDSSVSEANYTVVADFQRKLIA